MKTIESTMRQNVAQSQKRSMIGLGVISGRKRRIQYHFNFCGSYMRKNIQVLISRLEIGSGKTLRLTVVH